jgi:hypothetical protein
MNFNTLNTKCGVFPEGFSYPQAMKSIQKFFTSKSTLASLGDQLTHQAGLMQQVKDCLTAPLDEQIQAAVLRDQVLSLFVKSPAWASRLRYLAPQLLRQLKQSGLEIHEIRARIIPEEASIGIKDRHWHRPLLSEPSAESLRSTAEGLEAGALREAILRLSRHSEKKGPR